MYFSDLAEVFSTFSHKNEHFVGKRGKNSSQTDYKPNGL